MNNKFLNAIVILGSLFFHLDIFAQKVVYPVSRKVNVVDFYHGEKVFDPYRWLEDIGSPGVQTWVDSQNNLTRSYLDSIPFRQFIKERLNDLYNLPQNIMPVRRGGRYFFIQRLIGKNQGALFMRDSLDSEQLKVVDPNSLSDSGTIALTAWEVSHDGKYLAYALSYAGRDWQEIHLQDIDSSRDFKDVLKWCDFVDLAWSPDDSGIYYTRWPEPGTVPLKDQFKRNSLYLHRLGTSQFSDSLVFKAPEDEEITLSHYVSHDQKYLMLQVNKRLEKCIDLYYLEFGKTEGFKRLLHNEHNYYVYIDNVGPVFYFQTGLKAPGGKVISLNLEKPDRKYWREIIPAGDIVINYVTIIENQLVVAYMESAFNKLKILDLDGKFIQELELPAEGTIYSLDGSREDSIMYMGFESFVYPPTTYIYNFGTREFRPFDKSEFGFDLSPYVTRQIFYESDGGVKIPMFLTYNKDLLMDGNTATLLYGYGGFGISELPQFSSSVLFWLENGGVYAVANIRGGGEFGRHWHWVGSGPYKPTSFNDFANAAKWLIKSGITNSSKLAILGASNGGLLTAVSVEQNPKLFGAVICQVPVTDMMRFPQFTVGEYWINEYGDPVHNAAAFSLLRSYSPLHNVSHWNKYPPVLVTAGENDDRVPPLHAYKFIAALQSEDDREKPKLLRVETDAGHGRGKPENKFLDEQTDIFTFIFKSLDMKPVGWH
jgi:prolyl oligopeptidase